MSRDVAIVIGTAVGSYFGEPGLGYAIGSMVGNAYDPVKIGVQGPRLNDLKVQTSDYGKMIPVMYGASRFAGNVIWSPDVIETSHTQDSGGKGGGPVTSTTTYTYSQSFAIALCEGIVAGIGKVWANGKLIYNVSADATSADAAASKKLAQAMRFYTGTETQTADSLIQAHVGAANTPAYRGTAYAVFENFPLAEFGNRMPNMEFEVIQAGTLTHPAGSIVGSWAGVNNPTRCAFDPITSSIWVTNFGNNTVTKYNTANGTYTTFATGNGPKGIVYDPSSKSMWVAVFNANTVIKLDVSTGAITASYAVFNPVELAYDSVTGSVWVARGGYAVITKIDWANGTVTNVTIDSLASTAYTGIAFDPITSSIWLVERNYGILYQISVVNEAVVTKVRQSLTAWAGYGAMYGVEYEPVTGSIWLTFGSTTVLQKNISTGVETLHTVASGAQGITYDSSTGSMWTSNTSGSVSKINIATGAVTTYTIGNSPTDVAYDSATDSIWVPYGSVSFATAQLNISDWGLTSTAPTVGSVVTDICARVGLTASMIDVTQLTDTVGGYVTQRSTARVRIEQLMQAFYFDAVESDGKAKFVKRGGAPALTIAEDDLAAHLYGGQTPDNLLTERKQEMELPIEVNVQYMDTAAAYQVNSQRSQRLTTSSSNKMTLNFAISMTASKAKQISDVLMFDAWTTRSSFGFMNGWKYSYLEPTDVLGVTKGAYTYNVRMVEEDASSGVYNRSAVMEDSSIYTQSANAAPPVSPTTNISGSPLLNLQLLDIPLLRDQDDGVGFYAVASTYSGTWPGEQTYKSSDSGASWTQSGRAILNAATVGHATTILGNFSSGNFFDELNSVTVVTNGTLSSVTELNVLNGSNVCLIGNEVLQFKNATLIAANTYTLTGLLRGRRGTEWAMLTHAVGDRFVLLSTTTTYIFDSTSSEYNLARKYKGVAIGGFLDDALVVDFTNTAIAQKCYSPAQLGGGRNAANDVTLNWARRTRIGGSWNDFADVPLGEPTENYVVEIYSSAAYVTLKRTITGITSPTTTYTAAQQTADGLTPGNPVYFIVYQVSATVGNGYGARGVV